MKRFTPPILLLLLLSSPAFALLNKASVLRLTPDLRPHTQYQITVDLNPAMHSYSGHQQVKFTNKEARPTSFLLFFLYPNDPSLTKTKTKYLNVTNIQVNGVGGTT